MPQIPRDDPFNPSRRSLPQRGVRKEKLAEGETDADYLKGVPIDADIASATNGWALVIKDGEIGAAPITGEGGSVGTHAILDPVHTSMFLVTDGGDIDVDYGGGRARIDATVYEISPGTLTLTDDATNSVYINSSGAVAAGTSGFPSNSIPLAVVVTASGDITSITDRRALFYEDTAAGGGGTLDDAYDSGGAGAGRTVTADTGAVQLHNADSSVDANGVLELLRSAASDGVLDIWITGDTVARLRALASGELQWGPGSSTASDIQLKRSAAETLQIVAPGSASGTLQVDYLEGRSGSPNRVKFSEGAILEKLLRMTPASHTITAGMITMTAPYAQVSSGTLTTIGITSGAVFEGDFVFLSPQAGATVTIQHQASPSAGQIQCWGAADIVLDADYKWAICLRGLSNVWYAMGGGGGGASDHGALTGLADDDHTQYALLAGRATGQTLKGGTASGDDLTLQSTAHATKGEVIISDPLRHTSATAFSGDISPTIATSQNNYAPTGLSTATVIRLGPSADINITGLDASVFPNSADGQMVVLYNIGTTYTVTLKQDDTSTSTAANRFTFSPTAGNATAIIAAQGDIVLGYNDAAILVYDATTARWRCIGRNTSQTAPTICIELQNLAQGASKGVYVFPKAAYGYRYIEIRFQSNSTVAHNFTFYKNGAGIAATPDVNVGAASASGSTALASIVSFAAGDVLTVRHDTNAEDTAEDAGHVDEGGRIWAYLR